MGEEMELEFDKDEEEGSFGPWPEKPQSLPFAESPYAKSETKDTEMDSEEHNKTAHLKRDHETSVETSNNIANPAASKRVLKARSKPTEPHHQSSSLLAALASEKTLMEGQPEVWDASAGNQWGDDVSKGVDMNDSLLAGFDDL